MTKIGSFKKWNITVLSVSLLLGVLFASWYRVKHPAVEIVNVPTSPDTHTAEMSTPKLSDTSAKPSDTSATRDIPTRQKDGVPPIGIKKDAKPDIKAVMKGIDFLEALEKQNASKNKSGMKNGTADTGSELSQEELYQLIREGISYYDSLLESGSVDFFMQTSTLPFPGGVEILPGILPGMRRMPETTKNGSFEFSGNRLRGAVSGHTIQYDDSGETTYSNNENFAYDGETFERLVPAAKGFALIRSSDASYDSFYDPRWWGWNMQGQGTFSDVFDSLNVKNIQSVELNGNEVYHVTSIESNGGTFDLWINPEKNYRPELFVGTSSSEEGQTRTIRNFNFQEVAPDLWFPESAQATTTVIDTGGQETDILTHTIRFSNFKINQHIPSSRFNLDPLPRTTVYDRRSRESFKVPKEEN